MAASDNLGNQFDFDREINKQVIPKAHRDAIREAIFHHENEGVTFIPNGIRFDKDGKHHIVPSAFTEMHVELNREPSTSSFIGHVPNESQQFVIAHSNVNALGEYDWDKPGEGDIGIKRAGLWHFRWGASRDTPVPSYENKKSWEGEEPTYFPQQKYRSETDPSKMREYLRRHSFVGDLQGTGHDNQSTMQQIIELNKRIMGNNKPDPRVRVTVWNGYNEESGGVAGHYHYHPGTGAITRREPDHLG